MYCSKKDVSKTEEDDKKVKEVESEEEDEK